jgi:hypothetical protein
MACCPVRATDYSQAIKLSSSSTLRAISWKGTLVQYTGRLHRLHPGKIKVRIFDYADREVPMLLRMFEKRLSGYCAIGYTRGEAPLGFGEASEEVVVEYDPEARQELDTFDFS